MLIACKYIQSNFWPISGHQHLVSWHIKVAFIKHFLNEKMHYLYIKSKSYWLLHAGSPPLLSSSSVTICRLLVVHMGKPLILDNTVSLWMWLPESLRWSEFMVFSGAFSALYLHCIIDTSRDKPLFCHLQTCIKGADVTVSYKVLIEK